MKVLRTPDDRFQGLKDYDFAPSYVEIRDSGGQALRIHAVDEGPADSAPILLLHGEPSWSYLYRHMIKDLASRGHRVIAPDLVGFGRSDKPAAQSDYTYERHVAWMRDWMAAKQLDRITLFAQDWGGLIGLRLVTGEPQRFARVIVANTGLPTGSGMTDGFKRWLEFSQSVPQLPIGNIVDTGTARALEPAEITAYDAPFPDESFKAGARQFPNLVPITPEHGSVGENKAAWTILENFTKPVLTLFSDQDPVTKGGEKPFQTRIPGAAGQPHRTIQGAGHFLQEDRPQELAAAIDDFIRRTAG